MTDERRAQRMESLRKGNGIRVYRASVKADVRAGAMDPRLPVARLDPKTDSWEVRDYLAAVPGLGPHTALQTLRRVGARPNVLFGELGADQRSRLMLELRAHMGHSKRWADAQAAFKEAMA